MTKLDHIGIAVRSIESAKIYEALGLTIDHVETVASQGVKTAFLSVGDSNLELLEPTGPESPIAKFIEKRGPGMHHVAYRVPDIATALADYEAQGIELIDRQPRPGAGGHRVAFLHPKTTAGVLVELVEYPHSGAGA